MSKLRKLLAENSVVRPMDELLGEWNNKNSKTKCNNIDEADSMVEYLMNMESNFKVIFNDDGTIIIQGI